MADIDLHQEYNSSGESVQDLFDRTEEGFYVPLYQREYTWEEDNINQLFDDLVLGTRELADNTSATTFLGSTILTALGNKKESVRLGEERAQPTGVQIVIDGQQRISTISLLSIQIIVKLEELLDGLPQKPPYADLHNAGKKSIERLTKLHTIELGKGATPPQKPKIIRAREDKWTYDGEDDAYGSPVSHYIASFIRTHDPSVALADLESDTGARVRRNVKLIDNRLPAVCDAHITGTDLNEQFPVGKTITSARMQEYVLGFTDDSVKDVVEKVETDKAQNDYCAAATFQLLLLTYYLLRRCGINKLQPTRQEWGFDMFQALNATGTPLTVMETFLPQVMQAEHIEGNDWQSTPSRDSMDDILELFEATTTNEQKNRRTNELLGAFALCYEGKKLGNKFSEQRRWLAGVYEKKLPTIEDKRQFVSMLARTATFFYYGWYMEETTVPNCINGLEKHPEGEFASFLVRYLRDANSKLSVPLLARFYCQVLEKQSTYDEFVECVRACAAFFTLWRSANSTAGLDEIYRRYFRGCDAPVAVGEHTWKGYPTPVTVDSVKRYFVGVLQERGIADRDGWIAASERFLLYTELKTICRFVLFVAAHDRVADKTNLGLTVPGIKGSCTLLELGRWMSRDYRSLEHVAPQRPPTGHTWDVGIYEGGLVHQIGNLILLPLELNQFVDNKSWDVKYLHYCHVGERDQGELGKLSDVAKGKGIVLSKKATETLTRMNYNCAVESIKSVGETGVWDAKLVASRTRQVKELAWETLFPWLQP